MKKKIYLFVLLAFTVFYASGQSNNRGSTTGPTTAKGYDHPNQYLCKQPTKIADNMEPVMVHASQDKEAMEKLKEMEQEFGKKPNILIFLLDDVGWMDPGFSETAGLYELDPRSSL